MKVEKAQPINIDETGLYFLHDKPLEVGTDIEIQLLFLPEDVPFWALGVVIESPKGELPIGGKQASAFVGGKAFCIKVDFAMILESSLDYLVRQVLEKEGD